MTNKVTTLLLLILIYSCTPSNRKANDEELDPETQEPAVKVESFIPSLPDDLLEISGLLKYSNLFWGFNDSGGSPELYGFNTSGEIEKIVKVDNGINSDWESIAQDDQYIYIGDFGNNSGARQDLKILKISKEDVGDSEEREVNAETIEFSYATQTQFGYPGKSTPYDCEAMIEFGGSLYIFSKNWAEGTTSTYKVPKESGKYVLNPLDTFNVKGLVTGADISADSTKLALLGYENYHAFIWLFSGFSDDNFLQGKAEFIPLPDLKDAQTEGICFSGNDTLLISCEETKAFKQQVFLVDFKNKGNGTP